MDTPELNEIAALAADYVNHTNRHIFLTGKAGTGKTTFLRYITQHTYKNTVVAAPTGIAAINAGGVTLHSLLHLPFGAFVPEYQFEPDQHAYTKVNTPITLRRQRKFRKEKLALLREMELLIIDEVSMLRADLLDCIDVVLRSIRRNNSQPFGGLQILFIGDLLQLPPVVKQDEWTILQRYYKSAYFFDAKALQEAPPLCVELQKIYRQSDQNFIDLLNRLRHNQQLPDDLEMLNQYFLPKEEQEALKGYIYLTTHNRKADRINQERLDQLEIGSETFAAEVEGEFPENLYPTSADLELKVGAQVMFIKNDPSGEGQFFNGKIGEVSQLKKGEVWVRFEQQKPFQVEPYTWEHKRYQLNERTQEVEEDLIGTFAQYPIKLAWAVTIHKSQGLTFERAILDMQNTFAPGQLYVALSRLTSLKGLVLASPLPTRPPDMDAVLRQFVNGFPEADELQAYLEKDRIGFFWRLAKQAFDFVPLMEKLSDHESTFHMQGNRSLKQTFLPWTRKLIEETAAVVDPGKKFIQQVTNILAKGADLAHLTERMQKAQGYFEPILKAQLQKLAIHLAGLKGKRKAKHYREEVEELQDAFTHQLRQIMKLVMLVEENATGGSPSKARMAEWEIALQDQLKVAEPPKLSSHEQSFQLFREGKSIPEIAAERDLSIGTVEQHLTGYIEEGKLSITDLMPLEKINEILAVSGDEMHMVGKIKAELGDEYSYPEIRWALAHKRWELTQQQAETDS